MNDSQIINLALRMILEFLEESGYERRVKWEMTLRINRMLAGCNNDPNPEGQILDYNIYKLGLTLLLKSNYSQDIKKKAEDIFPRYLSLKDGESNE